MRYKIQDDDRKELFDALRQVFGSWKKAAEKIAISAKTLDGWRSGTHSIPEKTFQEILDITKLHLSSPVEKLADYWYTSHAGKIGAETSRKLYGNPGTPTGRRKGGLRAIEIHKQNPASRFRSEKPIRSPRPSKALAEVLGIFFGDGHAGKYQASVTLHSETDRAYGLYVARLIEREFSIIPSVKKRTPKKAIEIIVSSVAFVRFLATKGMITGNKIHFGLSIPRWIKTNKEYSKAFLRGLFDTDGCIYLDKHVIKKKEYRNLGWTITSHSDTLIVDIQEALKNLGFHPTHSAGQHSVFLRKHTDIIRYFEKIQTSNPKHQNRFQQFIKEKSHSG